MQSYAKNAHWKSIIKRVISLLLSDTIFHYRIHFRVISFSGTSLSNWGSLKKGCLLYSNVFV